MTGHPIVKKDDIQSRIYTMRSVQVMLDSDLAELYGVEIKRFNEQVKRNIERFPQEFSFQLTVEENNSLRSQFCETLGTIWTLNRGSTANISLMFLPNRAWPCFRRSYEVKRPFK